MVAASPLLNQPANQSMEIKPNYHPGLHLVSTPGSIGSAPVLVSALEYLDEAVLAADPAESIKQLSALIIELRSSTD